ncbi:NADP-dependent oxidoreductase [Rhodococcus sp. D2-41]|uniref:NADP-dependent oxidoreductase n=1 Tax=Speluncibacter jeojiensis TaxID=2710754 RepID=A0A9X4M0E8_9ACTN|nr:NADP-dependent oxidoreductase [Rhodococcus sp. D2-41]MDG3009771.1 NADP-dependent oxidoreductase [Rhodococcus sp. D2-41]MDG3014522.1 NADP-dependent oxidoreductase [Corynebacteriales bacterium D3-21]
MRTLRFHEYGPPLDVVRLDEAEIPTPGPGQVRIAVQACGLNPADWALCDGLFAGTLPRGIGLEVSGTVDALGSGVAGVEIGDAVLGPVPFRSSTAGASDHAVLDRWFPRPPGLDPVAAAALPMAVETAHHGLAGLGVPESADGITVFVNGAGTTVGYAAVQMVLRRGARVIASTGKTYADALRALGAQITAYGEGMAERILELAGGRVDLALDAAPVSNCLPEVVRTVGKPADVLTLSDFAAAHELGARTQFSANTVHDPGRTLGDYAQLAAKGEFTVPVARAVPLEDWRGAAELSLSGRAGGKLVLRLV